MDSQAHTIKVSDNVFNLSQETLTTDQINLLSKGLNFCPTYTSFNFDKYTLDVCNFIRRIKLHDFHTDFEDLDDSEFDTSLSDFDPTPKAFREPGGWTPSNGQLSKETLFFADKIQSRLLQIRVPDLPKKKHNLTKGQFIALRQLKNNNDIIIKPADKGSGTVIMSRNHYIDKCLQQLNDDNFYKKLSTDPTSSSALAVNNLIKRYKQTFLSDDQQKWIQVTEPRPANFYGLPKIHKNLINPDLRPILSANQCPTERISALVDIWINPIMQQQKSFVRDTSDLIDKLHKWTIPTTHTALTLVSFDVKSLYTNIPHNEGLDTLERMITKHHGPTTARILRQFAEATLKHNIIHFNGDFYLQIHGCAMGSRFSPAYACLFMAEQEEKWLLSAPLKPVLWLRYIDDILAIFPYTIEDVQKFVQWTNSQHDHIKITLEYTPNGIPFLDTFITLLPDRFRIRPYQKPTDTKMYLDPKSCHPEHTAKAIPYSQALRLARICSDRTDLQQELTLLKSYFTRRKYNPTQVQQAMDRAVHTLDLPTTTERREPTNKKILPLVVTYHPNLPNFTRLIHETFAACAEAYPKLTQIFNNTTFITANRKPKNLRDHLCPADITQKTPTKDLRTTTSLSCTACNFKRHVHTKIEITKKATDALQHILDTTLQNRNKHNSACKETRCKACTHLTSESPWAPNTKLPVFSNPDLTCKSENIIYAIGCINCNLIYIGKTTNNIQKRLWQHVADIKKPTTVVHQHLANHSRGNFRLALLYQEPEPEKLNFLEAISIYIHSTVFPAGLNSAMETRNLQINTALTSLFSHFLHHTSARPIIHT